MTAAFELTEIPEEWLMNKDKHQIYNYIFIGLFCIWSVQYIEESYHNKLHRTRVFSFYENAVCD